jgi:glycosyltransferase involved in cell wall biosynthesis
MSTLKILMIAPEPVFRIRGTPFSIRDRCRALSELGHQIDLLTYPFGDDFCVSNVNIHRIRHVPGIKDIKIGFSWSKIPLDTLLFIKAFLALHRTRYDLIHTHEEAGMMGAILSPLFRIPHLYDMHSSLPQQFENYKTSSAKPVIAFMRWSEKIILKNSHAVIAICPHLKDLAIQASPEANVHVIENMAQQQGDPPTAEDIAAVRQKYKLENTFVIGYTGTFEVNQGLEMMAQAFAQVKKDIPDGMLFFAGGTSDQIKSFQNVCQALGIDNRTVLTGALPPENMQTMTAACDVLVSPRRIGTNTPLKIYSYLKSGVAILATDLLTHTQVLDHNTAVLVEPSSEALADGLLTLYNNPDLRSQLADSAVKLEKEQYSWTAYCHKLTVLLDSMQNMTQ